MKIKLIMAASPGDPLRKRDPFMPLSLPILAAAAPDHEYSLVDMFWDDDAGLDEKTDLAGLSIRATSENTAYKLADAFRKRNVPVVLGGPQAWAKPFEAINHADAVAVGEAEALWPQIVKDAQCRRLKSFYVCSPKPFDGRGKTVFQIFEYPSLDRIPPPHRHLYRRKYVFDTVFASRGCPIDCDFCAVSRLFGKAMRLRPIDDVVAEINSLGRYFYLIDDTVFGRASTYDYYVSLYKKIAALPRKRFWTGQANLDAAADSKGRDVIQSAVDAGLLYAAIGIESIDPRTLEKSGAIAKMGVRSADEAVGRMKEHIRFIQDLGVIISAWFVVGYEDDSIETYGKTWEFCREMRLIPAIFPVRALPGTGLYERAEKKGMLDDSRSINLIHPAIREADVRQALRRIQAEAFSPAAIAARTLYYARRFSRDRIHKSIFSLVLQWKLRGGLDDRDVST